MSLRLNNLLFFIIKKHKQAKIKCWKNEKVSETLSLLISTVPLIP